MTVECEIKLLGINPKAIRNFFAEQGAKCQARLNFKRVIFDTMPVDPNAWIRLRSNGDETTLTYKKIHSKAIDGTEEIETTIGNFEKMKDLLQKAGLDSRNYQENTREVYKWMDCEITIDSWPLLDPYVEVEAANKAIVEECVKKLNGLYKTSTTESTDSLYEKQGINLRSITELKFPTN